MLTDSFAVALLLIKLSQEDEAIQMRLPIFLSYYKTRTRALLISLIVLSLISAKVIYIVKFSCNSTMLLLFTIYYCCCYYYYYL